jgi:predicted  nucleic acid-binding Zn-ribbon protein
MNVFEMVVIIVVVTSVCGVASSWLKSMRNASSARQNDLDEAMDRIDDLEERIRVLEAVVTDDRYDLAREIDGLKDKGT